MPYPPSKTENGAPVKKSAHEKYLSQTKRNFLVVVFVGVCILFLAMTRLGATSKNFITSLKLNISSLAYAIEYSTSRNGVAFNNDGPADSVAVLVYHGLLKKADNSVINTTVKNFKDQMFALKREGYTTIDTEDLLAFMRGERELPKRSIMITFDDGRYDSYANADPILEALGFKAVMFAISNFSLGEEKNSYYIREDDIKRMDSSGRWDIQAHTHDGHDNIQLSANGDTGPFFGNFIWFPGQHRLETEAEFRKRIGNDMDTVKERFEKLLDKKITSFAVPFGDYGQTDYNLPPQTEKGITLEEAGKRFSMLFYQYGEGDRFEANYKIEQEEADNLFRVKRIDSQPEWRGNDLMAVLETSQGKELPYVEDFKSNHGWIRSWGSLTINSSQNNQNNYDEMIISSSGPDHAGAASILDGTRMWGNYILKTRLLLPNRNSAFAWVRFQNDKNNAGCNLGEGFIHIEQTLGGESRVIKGVIDPSINIPQEEFEFDVTVNGRNISCSVNGKVLIETTFLDPSLDNGGIGFKTWDTVPGRGFMVIKQVKVEPI